MIRFHTTLQLYYFTTLQFTTLLLYSFTNLLLYNFTTVLLYRFTTLLLYSCTTSRPIPEPPQKDQTPNSPMPPSSSNPFCSWVRETKGRPALHGLCEGTVPLLQCSSLRDYIEPRAFVGDGGTSMPPFVNRGREKM